MKTYDELADAFHAHFSRNPNARAFLGVERALDELPDPSLAHIQAGVTEARSLLAAFESLCERQQLPFDQRLDADLARLMLDREVHGLTFTFNDRTEPEQKPTCGDDVGDGIFILFANDPRPDDARLAEITGRIEKVPDYVEALLSRLATPVARWVKMDMEKVAGLPSLFATLRGWAEEKRWKDAPRLAKATAAAETALTSYSERLAELPTAASFHVGDAVARRIVALRGIEKSLEEIHRYARDFLAENERTIQDLRGKIAKKHGLPATATVEDVDRLLADRYKVEVKGTDTARVLARYEAEKAKILSFIEERDLFPIFEGQDMKILETPVFMRPSIPAGAMVSPPPFREGVRRSLIYLTLSEELMDEHTELSIPGMMIHEGIPGHHLQLATAGTHPSVIRRHIDCMDLSEGWTTMLEDYMLDMGYMGDLTDEARFVGKRDINRIGARVAIDLFFMTGEKKFLDVGVECDLSSDDPFASAGALLAKTTGFVPGRVQAELNWYSTDRGYPLSYLTGNRLVWELKRDVIAAQKGTREGVDLDREFHRVFLQAGNMPVSFLRRVMEREGLL